MKIKRNKQIEFRREFVGIKVLHKIIIEKNKYHNSIMHYSNSRKRIYIGFYVYVRKV